MGGLQVGKTLVQSETGPDLKVYTILWIIDSVVTESNERFIWKRVRAHWSGFGTMPRWHQEPRTFLLDRRRRESLVAGGTGSTL